MDLVKWGKGLAEKAAMGILGVEKKSLGLPYPDWQLIGGLWVQMADDPKKYIDEGYKGNVYMHAIVSHIIDKASDAPGAVYKVKDQRKAKAYAMVTKGIQNPGSIQKALTLKSQAFEEIEDHPFMELMKNPNPITTEKQFKREFLGYERITGNSYAYVATPGIGLNPDKPMQLWVIPSPTVEIVAGSRQEPIKGYSVSYYGDDPIPKNKVIHMKTFNPVSSVIGGNWLYGMAPVQANRAGLGQFKQANTAQGTLFKNMGPGGIISGVTNGVITEPQAIAIQDKFVQRHVGTVNGGGLVVTPANLQYTQIGMSAVDLNIIAAKGDLLQEICATYNYPKERITGSSNTASQGTADKQVITSCVMPLLRDFDDTMTSFIREAYRDQELVYISDTQYFPELQSDRKDLAQWASQAWWLTVNEKRKAMDYEEVQDGDLMLVPSGLAKYEDIIADQVDPDVNMLDNEGLNDFNNNDDGKT